MVYSTEKNAATFMCFFSLYFVFLFEKCSLQLSSSSLAITKDTFQNAISSSSSSSHNDGGGGNVKERVRKNKHQVNISHVRTKYKIVEISDCVNEINGSVVSYAVAAIPAAITITYF